MRPMPVWPLAALIFVTLVANSGAASAAEYPWCLIEGRRGIWSCGYVSFAQCMATRTATEMCNVNPRYSPQTVPARRTWRPR